MVFGGCSCRVPVVLAELVGAGLCDLSAAVRRRTVLHCTRVPAHVERRISQHMAIRGFGYGHLVVDGLLLPLRFTCCPARFQAAGDVGLGLLGFVPFVRAEPGANEKVVWFGAWMLVCTVLWFVTAQEGRYLLHVIAPLCCFARGLAQYVSWRAVRRG